MHKTQRKRLVLSSETIRIVALRRGSIHGAIQHAQDTGVDVPETPQSDNLECPPHSFPLGCLL